MCPSGAIPLRGPWKALPSAPRAAAPFTAAPACNPPGPLPFFPHTGTLLPLLSGSNFLFFLRALFVAFYIRNPSETAIDPQMGARKCISGRGLIMPGVCSG